MDGWPLFWTYWPGFIVLTGDKSSKITDWARWGLHKKMLEVMRIIQIKFIHFFPWCRKVHSNGAFRCLLTCRKPQAVSSVFEVLMIFGCTDKGHFRFGDCLVIRVQARGRLGEIVAPVVSRVALGNLEGDKNFALHFQKLLWKSVLVTPRAV